MPDSRSREPGHESPTHIGAVDGDSLWQCYATTKQNPCTYLAMNCYLLLFFTDLITRSIRLESKNVTPGIWNIQHTIP